MSKLARLLLLASALALPVTATHFAMTTSVAEAAGKKARMGKGKTAKTAKVARVAKVKKGKRAKATRVAAYKSCGTFMFRKGGKCMDARLKK